MAEGIVTGNEPVLVQSRRNKNNSVSVIFKKTFVKEGGIEDERSLSRTYTFDMYEARIPFKMAKILVQKNPEEYAIVSAFEEGNEALNRQIEEFNTKVSKLNVKYKCRYCGMVCNNAGSLISHKKAQHLEAYSKEKIDKSFKKKRKKVVVQ